MVQTAKAKDPNIKSWLVQGLPRKLTNEFVGECHKRGSTARAEIEKLIRQYLKGPKN